MALQPQHSTCYILFLEHMELMSVLHYALQSTSGFLPKKEVAAIYGPDAQLLPGQLIEAVVKAAPSNRQVQVSIEPEAVANSQLQEWDGLNLSALLPGSLVTARVRAVLKDGLTVSFMTYFHGTIDLYHLAEPIPAENWKSQYHIGQKLRARILYVDPINKKAGLSLCNHLVSLQLPTAVPRLGQVGQEDRCPPSSADIQLLVSCVVQMF